MVAYDNHDDFVCYMKLPTILLIDVKLWTFFSPSWAIVGEHGSV